MNYSNICIHCIPISVCRIYAWTNLPWTIPLSVYRIYAWTNLPWTIPISSRIYAWSFSWFWWQGRIMSPLIRSLSIYSSHQGYMVHLKKFQFVKCFCEKVPKKLKLVEFSFFFFKFFGITRFLLFKCSLYIQCLTV